MRAKVVLLVVAVGISLLPLVPGRGLADSHLVASFDWTMADRFGLDTNSDGLIDYFQQTSDLPGLPSDIRPDDFLVTLNGCTSSGGVGFTYGWQIRGGPDLASLRRGVVGSLPAIAGLMWNHSHGMTAEFTRRGIPRVTFSGQEMADVVREVILAGPDGDESWEGERLQFAYRRSNLPDRRVVTVVFVDVAVKDYEGYVREAQRVIQEKVQLPPGYHLEWAGQYRYLLRMKERLQYIIPLTLFLIFLLLYLNFNSWKEPLIVFLAVPFSLIGAVWLLWLLGYNLSIAVWVGMIALAEGSDLGGKAIGQGRACPLRRYGMERNADAHG